VSWWREQVVPRAVDCFLGTAEVTKMRQRACAGLTGDVVEIGFGSGRNVEHYPPEVDAVWAVEPSDVAWRKAQPRIGAHGADVRRAGLDGQALDLPADRFDSALSAFTMCTIPDLDAALAELRRVLRSGGRLHFVEHGRSPDPAVARWQDRLQPIHGRLAGGCHLDRSIGDHLERSGFEIDSLDTFYSEGPKVFGYISLGSARKVC
jgi:ubiquinone/menaquinone biosynthesis C-methylase UbiE